MPESLSEHAGAADTAAKAPTKALLFDLSGIDLGARIADKAEIAKWNPHRGNMAFLDHVVWVADDYSRAVGLRQVRADEFWVAGHFPDKPMYPGVFQIETAAQLACFVFARRKDKPTLAAFLRIENCSFRSMVEPGDDLFILLQDVKFHRKRFIVDVQGVVGTRVTFECQISGMAME